MAGALGGAQVASNQNTLQSATTPNDPLTLHLAKLSRSQLTEVMSGLKVPFCVYSLLSPYFPEWLLLIVTWFGLRQWLQKTRIWLISYCWQGHNYQKLFSRYLFTFLHS